MSTDIGLRAELRRLCDNVPAGFHNWDGIRTQRFKSAVRDGVALLDKKSVSKQKMQEAIHVLNGFHSS